MKYWIGEETEIIVINDETIFCSNSSVNKEICVATLSNGEIPSELFNLPISYIRQITLKDIENKINIYFGEDSCETLIINDEEKRLEIFEVLKNCSPNFLYKTETVGKLKVIQKPWLAFVFLSFIFGMSYHMALNIEANELEGEQFVILLYIAELGSKMVMKIYFIVLSVLLLIFYKQLKKSHTLNIIARKK